MFKQSTIALATMLLTSSLAAAQGAAPALKTFIRGTVSTTAVEWPGTCQRK